MANQNIGGDASCDGSGVEAFTHRLITMLDELDPDGDLEPELGEPYLGWPNFGQPATAEMSRDDEREIEDEHGGRHQR